MSVYLVNPYGPSLETCKTPFPSLVSEGSVLGPAGWSQNWGADQLVAGPSEKNRRRDYAKRFTWVFLFFLLLPETLCM